MSKFPVQCHLTKAAFAIYTLPHLCIQLDKKKSGAHGVAYGSFLGFVSHSLHTIPSNWEVF